MPSQIIARCINFTLKATDRLQLRRQQPQLPKTQQGASRKTWKYQTKGFSSFSQVRGLFTFSPNHGFYTKRQKFHIHQPWIPLRSFWSMTDFSLNIENMQLHSLWHRSRKCWRETNQKTCKGESSGGHLLLLLTRGLLLVTRSPCYLLSGRRVSYWVGRCTQNKLTNALVGGPLGPN